MTAPTGPLVLGTAGHIDHGKTSLVKALTGIDTDRLKEEQERGITIELGFAHLTLPGGAVVGVIDVPGHERFVRTMVAGAVGLDAVLLVVAADEGVMPQTREHLEICELLGVQRGVIALTKSDLVDGELLAMAVAELRQELAASFLAEAPIVPCSARTGDGLPQLLAALAALLATTPSRSSDGVARLPVDRVFALRGFGTVATGTLFSGRLRVGDELSALPGVGSSTVAKVRGLQVHGQPVAEAVAGQRTAVNLALPRQSLQRGDSLVAPELLRAGLLLEAELRYLAVANAPLPRRSQLLFHAVGAQRLCGVTLLDRDELLPGERGLCQLQLDQPLVLLPGDRFVLRGFTLQKNRGTTVGGGLVLRTLSSRQRRGTAALLATMSELTTALAGLRQPPQREVAIRTLIVAEVERLGSQGASLLRLRQTLPVGEPELLVALGALGAADQLLAVAPLGTVARGIPREGAAELLLFGRAAVAGVAAAVRRTLALHHQREPRASGLPRETLRSQLGSGAVAPSPRLFQQVVEQQLTAGELVADGGVLRLASHRVASDEAGHKLSERLTAIYEQAGLAPPRLDELPGLLAAPPDPLPAVEAAALRMAIDGLLRRGVLRRVQELLFLRRHLDELGQRLFAYLRAEREISPTGWKELCGQSRKYSIPLAEYFDAEQLTLRVGDRRRLRSR